VTIGQTTGPPGESCGSGFDWAQPTVTSGNSYVVPAAGGVTVWTLTSWSHNAGPVPGQTLTMKVFRKVADPATYMAVAHDGPRALTAGVLNTFAGISLAVRAGDVLGLYTVTDSGCAIGAPGDTFYFRQGNLADGESGVFATQTEFRLNVSAQLEPDCD
jgi:Ca2+-binding RTX toxin-like protein